MLDSTLELCRTFPIVRVHVYKMTLCILEKYQNFVNRPIYLMGVSILSLYLSGELTLVAIGPLTNIAMAIRMDPWFGKRLKKCYIMGGNYLGK